MAQGKPLLSPLMFFFEFLFRKKAYHKKLVSADKKLNERDAKTAEREAKIALALRTAEADLEETKKKTRSYS